MNANKKYSIGSFGFIVVLLILIGSALFIFSKFFSKTDHGPEFLKSRAEIEMRDFIYAMQSYESAYNTYPSGTTSEILQKLVGDNPGKIAFFLLSPRATNASGEFVDPWGTSFEIKVVSSNRVTIRSAGKNRKFGDTDDLEVE